MISELLIAGGSIAIAGRRWPLLITHGVLLHCERSTGVDVLNSFRITEATSGALLALLWAALRRAGAEYSTAELGALVTMRNLPAVRRAIYRAWAGSMPEARKASGAGRQEDKKPTHPLTHLAAWAFARMELGLSDAEWLDATPRMIQELSDVRLRRMQWEEMMNGINTAETVNHSFCRPEKPRRAEAFMIHPLEGESREGGSRKLNSGEHVMNLFLRTRGTKVVKYENGRV